MASTFTKIGTDHISMVRNMYTKFEKKWRWYIFEIVTIVKMAVMAKKMAKMQKMQKKLIFQLKKIYLR